MDLSPPPALPLEALHPALWRAAQLGHERRGASPSGWPELDALLPSRGWPHRALTELLLPHPGLGELRLLAPLLAAAVAAGRSVMLLNPPARPCAWALAALGLDTRAWLLVQPRAAAGRPGRGLLLPEADLLWALEQALASGQLGPVLAWLPPRLGITTLRRLQLAAQAHDAPVFLFREPAAAQRPSVAPLRLQLRPAGVGQLRLDLLKRRGPPAAAPLHLVLPPVPGLMPWLVPGLMPGRQSASPPVPVPAAASR